MKQKKRPVIRRPRAVASKGTLRIGFSEDAKIVFDQLSLKVRNGLRSKLRAFGANPKTATPLVGTLAGYHLLSYGPRSTAASIEAIVLTSKAIVLVHFLYVGARKRQDEATELFVQSYLSEN